MERRSCDTDGRHDGGFSRPRVAVLPRAVIQRAAARDVTTALSGRALGASQLCFSPRAAVVPRKRRSVTVRYRFLESGRQTPVYRRASERNGG